MFWEIIEGKIREEFNNIFDFFVKLLEYGLEELFDWYLLFFDDLINKVISFREECLYELIIFFSEFIRSDYVLKFIVNNKIIN